MRLQELLFETPEEDRAIISLADAINRYILKYEVIDDEDPESWKNKDYDAEIDDIEEISSDKPLFIGKIGQLFDTPLHVFNHINLQLISDYAMRLMVKKQESGKKIKRPEEELVLGMWDASNDTVYLNRDFIGSNSLKTIIAHELRHALDDIKSEYQANKLGGRYTRPKSKKHRKERHSGDLLPYHAQPAEINARFAEVLHLLVPHIKRAISLPDTDAREYSINKFYQLLRLKNIQYLFPEEKQSRAFKRLVSRGEKFIDKELLYLKSL